MCFCFFFKKKLLIRFVCLFFPHRFIRSDWWSWAAWFHRWRQRRRAVWVVQAFAEQWAAQRILRCSSIDWRWKRIDGCWAVQATCVVSSSSTTAAVQCWQYSVRRGGCAFEICSNRATRYTAAFCVVCFCIIFLVQFFSSRCCDCCFCDVP